MRKIMLAAVLGLSLSLGACVSTEGVAPNSCGIAADTVKDEKAMYAAELAYNIPANAYVTLDAQGLLSTETKAKVRPHLISAYNALTVARTAHKLSNTCAFYNATALVKQSSDAAKALLNIA